MTIKAMKQALEALNYLTNEMIDQDFVNQGMDAITSLRQAIEQAEKQEPVAWMDEFGNVFPLGAQRGPKYLNEPMKPLYTTPQPQRQWVGFTDEEISDMWCEVSNTDFVTADTHVFARAIEAKLKEKNT